MDISTSAAATVNGKMANAWKQLTELADATGTKRGKLKHIRKNFDAIYFTGETLKPRVRYQRVLSHCLTVVNVMRLYAYYPIQNTILHSP